MISPCPSLPPWERGRPWLLETCLCWNNKDLLAPQFPRTLRVMLAISHPMTQLSCCHESWLPAILPEVVYHALLMPGCLSESVQEKCEWKVIFWACYIYLSEFRSINAQRHIFQPCVPLNSLGHSHCIPVMWTPLTSSLSILGASGGSGKRSCARCYPCKPDVEQEWVSRHTYPHVWLKPLSALLVIFSFFLNRLHGQKKKWRFRISHNIDQRCY